MSKEVIKIKTSKLSRYSRSIIIGRELIEFNADGIAEILANSPSIAEILKSKDITIIDGKVNAGTDGKSDVQTQPNKTVDTKAVIDAKGKDVNQNVTGSEAKADSEADLEAGAGSEVEAGDKHTDLGSDFYDNLSVEEKAEKLMADNSKKALIDILLGLGFNDPIPSTWTKAIIVDKILIANGDKE